MAGDYKIVPRRELHRRVWVGFFIWGLPKIRGTSIGPHKDCNILGSILGSLILGNHHIGFKVQGHIFPSSTSITGWGPNVKYPKP